MSSQELMTPELAQKIAYYEESATRWRHKQNMLTRGAWFCLAMCVLLWVISFFAAGFEGPVNRTQWLATFAIATFAGGFAFGVAFVVCCTRKIVEERPTRPVVQVELGR